jgi:hypothetical protein
MRESKSFASYDINTDCYMVIWGNENQFMVIDRNNIDRQYWINRRASEEQVRRTLGIAPV